MSVLPLNSFAQATFLLFFMLLSGMVNAKVITAIRGDVVAKEFSPCLSSGCLACCSKPKLIPPVKKPPPKGFKTKDRTTKKPSQSEDFWSTSLFDMENSAVQSQRSISSISTSNHTHDPLAGSGSGGAPEFVNHGLLLWNQTRQQWVGNKRQETRPDQVRQPNLSWNVTYEGLLGSNKPFSQPLPLSEMVDFLVDTWEQEGMYD